MVPSGSAEAGSATFSASKYEMNPEGLKRLQRSQQVCYAPGKAVELPHDYSIEAAPLSRRRLLND